MIRRVGLGALVASFAALGLGACANGEDDSSSEDSVGSLGYEITGDSFEDLASCLSFRGWDVERTEGGVSGALSGDQVYEDFEADNDECLTEIGYDRDRYFSDEFLVADYAARVEQASCYERAGFPVSEPPTLETYIEQTQANRIAYWMPDDEALDTYGELPQSVWEDCPMPNPWDFEFSDE